MLCLHASQTSLVGRQPCTLLQVSVSPSRCLSLHALVLTCLCPLQPMCGQHGSGWRPWFGSEAGTPMCQRRRACKVSLQPT